VAWSPLLLTLLAHCTGSWAQAVLTQPPSESGSLGQRVTLSCTGSSSNIGGGNSVNWSQPLPGKVPRSVFTYANLMAIAAPDQFSGFKSGSSGTLTITGLQAEDDAEYYCTAGGDSLDGPTVPQARGQVRPKPAVPQPGGSLGRAILCIISCCLCLFAHRQPEPNSCQNMSSSLSVPKPLLCGSTRSHFLKLSTNPWMLGTGCPGDRAHGGSEQDPGHRVQLCLSQDTSECPVRVLVPTAPPLYASSGPSGSLLGSLQEGLGFGLRGHQWAQLRGWLLLLPCP
uniref:Ig-like domain-containing protein n=1 Tax=Sus scrofa TaxID=9823 RepID=A0A287AM45_PIG